MSRIAKLVGGWEEMEDFSVHQETKKTSFNFRMGEAETYRLDFLAKHFQMSRSKLCEALVDEACIEALEALGFTVDAIMEKMVEEKFGKEAAENFKKTGIEVKNV